MKSVLFMSLMNGGAWGGSEELWYQTALYAARNGYKVGCAFYEWPQKKARIEQLRQAGCELYLFSNKGREKRTLLERLQYKVTKRKVRRLGYGLPFAQYDVTVVNLGYLEITSHYWKNLYKHLNRYALLFHVHDESDTLKPKQKRLIATWLSNAEHNLFASARTIRYLEQQLGTTVPNAGILINPISFKAPALLTPYPPLQKGSYLFVMLATLDTRRKAQDNLVKALSAPKWRDRPWQLHLYGGGDSEQQLKSLIAETGMHDKVTLKGHTSKVKEALVDAHLLLQVTHIDAMPLAVMEALAMGRPLVVSDVGDMPQWVDDGVNGWISEDASVEAIDRILEKAWSDRDRWEEMGRASFRLFSEKFPRIPEAYFLDQVGGGGSR